MDILATIQKEQKAFLSGEWRRRGKIRKIRRVENGRPVGTIEDALTEACEDHGVTPVLKEGERVKEIRRIL